MTMSVKAIFKNHHRSAQALATSIRMFSVHQIISITHHYSPNATNSINSHYINTIINSIISSTFFPQHASFQNKITVVLTFVIFLIKYSSIGHPIQSFLFQPEILSQIQSKLSEKNWE
jgi:hypothetical protein